MFAYLGLLHHALVLIIHVVVTVLCILILNRKIVQLKASPTLMLFFYYLITLSLTGLIYRGYLISFWKAENPIYDQRTLYFIGITQWVLFIANPVLETCLCFERCIAVTFPFQYAYKFKLPISFMTAMVLLLISSMNIMVNNLYIIPESSPTACMYFTCVMKVNSASYNYKIVVSLIELASALGLLLVIRAKPLPYATSRRKNRAILIIVFTSIVLDFAPNFLDQIYSCLTNEYLFNLLGPYHSTLGETSILISVISYYHVFSESKRKLITNIVSPVK